LHRFGEIGQKSLYSATPLAFNPPDRGVPLGRSPYISPGCQRMANVPNGVETFPKVSTG